VVKRTRMVNVVVSRGVHSPFAALLSVRSFQKEARFIETMIDGSVGSRMGLIS
jgi:hypothetical protein